MIASKHSCKVFHQQNPPTIPCGRRAGNQNRSKPSPPLRTLQETWARSNVKKVKHIAKVFQPQTSENEPKEEEALHNFWRPSTNLNHQSIISKELNFKKSSTA
jgi:hypothetical protein